MWFRVRVRARVRASNGYLCEESDQPFGRDELKWYTNDLHMGAQLRQVLGEEGLEHREVDARAEHRAREVEGHDLARELILYRLLVVSLTLVAPGVWRWDGREVS